MDTEVLKTQSLAWLLAAATDPMLIADEQGLIVLANEAAHRLFGYPPPALSGQPVEILVPEGVAGDHARLRATYAEQPRARPMGKGLELQARHAGGYLFPVEVSLSPLETPDGARLVMATIHDISARKRYETALLESEERMRAVFETAVDAIITIDERGLVERMNPAAQRIFGWTEAEVSGQNISMLMPSPDRERHDGYLHHYISTGEKRIIGKGREVKGLRKNGTVFPMDLAVAEMRISGKRMFTGLVRDITERKQAEERNAALLAELTSANEELTNFAYVVSHDLKAPLRAIGSLADWLATDYADKFNDEGKEHMRLLINRVHRMAALIDGILQYSRVGRVREAGATIDLNRVLAEVVDLLAPPPHIQVRVQAGLPTVTAEPTRIHQLFHNLLSNAIKYMDKPEGTVDVGYEDAGHDWHFQVRDNGPGIESRHFERIFQLFQTLAPRDRVESTGVGLALVKKIVEMYGGRVWVESVVKQGTTFHFTLPKTRQE